MSRDSKPLFPASAWVLLGVYFVASFAHFAHNAEFIAFYPNMPPSLTREKVYLAWLAISSIGGAAILTTWLGWRVVGALLLVAYGAFGLDALGHYALALCSEHTLAANLTIWFEVEAGLALLLAGSVLAKRYHCRSQLRTGGAWLFARPLGSIGGLNGGISDREHRGA